MSRSLWARLAALVAVVLLGTYYIFVDVLQYRIGAQRFSVTVMAPQGGGIYQGAVVSYRGVPVGQVSTVAVHTDGVAIHLAINPGTQIPTNAKAQVKELSALGEQYLDLDPTSPGAPYLHSGSVIPAWRVTLPTPIGVALLDLGSLLNSVNPVDLQTLEAFFTDGFTGTGPDLRTIVVTGQRLFQALVDAQAQTVHLVLDGQPVLQAFQATDNQFATFTQGLAQVTAQLNKSNGDLQGLISNGLAAEAQLNPFLGANNANVASTIQSLSVAAGTASTYQPSVQAFFQVLPVVTGQLGSVASNGQVHGELTINTANTVCPYLPASLIPLPTQAVATPALDNGCSTVAPDLLQRGVRG